MELRRPRRRLSQGAKRQTTQVVELGLWWCTSGWIWAHSDEEPTRLAAILMGSKKRRN